MPDIETMEMDQVAVLWPAMGTDRYGQVKVGSPVEIAVRWEWTQTETVSPDGQAIVSEANVVVDRDVAEGSCLWEGSLEDWHTTGSLAEGNRLQQVIAFRRTPDLRNKSIRRVAMTHRYKDTLPDLGS